MELQARHMKSPVLFGILTPQIPFQKLLSRLGLLVVPSILRFVSVLKFSYWYVPIMFILELLLCLCRTKYAIEFLLFINFDIFLCIF